ncbi:hypothetical protein [Hymenobacter sp. YC55]|uniref:hypothetical protein n=1 Tax=Hymenobacter sp. YC55 TaxID=3034019 RepID=UPI0023F7EE2A|nr:hypothetical protein [Hymenobacter sp. YC55]MDF7815229.1 hypothetical protein [Hymenobacter sp. YC55]
MAGKSPLASIVIGTWLLSLGLMVLTLTTPLEFTPLPFDNLPRWGVWGLAFPACRLLGVRPGWRRRLWRTVPWLLWAPLLLVQIGWSLSLLLASSQDWSRLLDPTRGVFARPQRWQTKRVLFRRGWQVVALQRHDPQDFHPYAARTAQLTPVLPGLQWATRLTRHQRLDASWQVSDLPDLQANPRTYFSREVVRLSGDSTVLRLLRLRLPQGQRLRIIN